MNWIKLVHAGILCFVAGVLCTLFLWQNYQTQNKAVFRPFDGTLSESNVLYVLKQINVQHPEIVLNQAKLETGNFTSTLALQQNNLFGLYNSSKGEYYTFSHWIESCFAYKWFVQRKYKGGCYYTFLEQLPYAQDPLYIQKLKKFE